MDMNEFTHKMLDAFPDAEYGTDNDGQLVIYTGLKYVDETTIVSMSDLDAANTTTFCGCENSHCSHKEAMCSNPLPKGKGGSPKAPWMAFIGPVCIPCAEQMGNTRPEWITPPFGTYYDAAVD